MCYRDSSLSYYDTYDGRWRLPDLRWVIFLCTSQRQPFLLGVTRMPSFCCISRTHHGGSAGFLSSQQCQSAAHILIISHFMLYVLHQQHEIRSQCHITSVIAKKDSLIVCQAHLQVFQTHTRLNSKNDIYFSQDPLLVLITFMEQAQKWFTDVQTLCIPPGVTSQGWPAVQVIACSITHHMLPFTWIPFYLLESIAR